MLTEDTGSGESLLEELARATAHDGGDGGDVDGARDGFRSQRIALFFLNALSASVDGAYSEEGLVFGCVVRRG